MYNFQVTYVDLHMKEIYKRYFIVPNPIVFILKRNDCSEITNLINF